MYVHCTWMFQSNSILKPSISEKSIPASECNTPSIMLVKSEHTQTCTFQWLGTKPNLQARSIDAILGAFTLVGISGIQILVFESRSKSWDFYKCGHENLTNYSDQHRKKSCDYLGISAIICIAADVWTLEQIILVFYIPSFQVSVSKQGQGLYSGLISGMRSSVNRIIPLCD